MMDVETLRSKVTSKKRTTGDALIDIAYEAKISTSTVWKFIKGRTSTPTFLTRWGLQKYLQKK